MLKRNIIHSNRHTKFIKTATVVALIILAAVLIAYGWQKYEEEKYPEGTEKNYKLPDTIMNFFRIMGDLAKNNEESVDEDLNSSAVSEAEKENIVEIVVGHDNTDEGSAEASTESIEIEEIGGIVPENKEPCDISEFENVLFVGDYFVYAMENSYFLNSDFAYTTDLDMNTMLTKKAIKQDGTTMTIVDYVSTFENINTIYVLISAESISWMDCPTFVKKYTAFIDAIIEAKPDAEIYVQSILPINEPMAQKRSYSVTNSKIKQINTYISELAIEKELWYLDFYKYFADTSGALPAEFTTNGIRLTTEAYETWNNLILTHKA